MSKPAQKCENIAIFKQNCLLLRMAYLFLLLQFRGKYRFPPKIIYNIDYLIKNLKEPMGKFKMTYQNFKLQRFF